ncbi:MAG: outer membrane protein assembly factor BamE, partial [Pseudomonadota bacterium]
MLRGNTVSCGNRSPALRTGVAVVAVAILLAGCTRLRDRQGYVAEEEMVTSVAPGVDNRESVERTLGRPTFQSAWDDGTWYYVSRNTSQFAFLPPKATEQEI